MTPIDPVKVVLLGEPVGSLFTPTRQRNNAAALKLAAQQAMTGRALFDCPIRLHLQAEFLIPASWSRRKRQAALRQEIRPGKRPDLSNIAKQVEDAIQYSGFQARRADC
jgi:Holliday junction resolvase RusA-like endonuclease